VSIPVQPVTVDRVVEEMRAHYPGQWVLALDLQMVAGQNTGIRGSIQGISNALRHGHQRGLIERRYVSHKGYVSEWMVRP
jgi:hypothetical protein